LYIDILSWYVKESGHPGYLNTSIPEDCPQPLLVEDIPTKNNTDESSEKTVETNNEGGTYYFSSAQDPSQHTSVYGSSDIFALAMFQCPSITEMMIGVKMKVMSSSIVCTNTKNISILKSYINVILVPDISSMLD
jgi:hypothetical protein